MLFFLSFCKKEKHKSSWVRTNDKLIKSQLLYLLSYALYFLLENELTDLLRFERRLYPTKKGRVTDYPKGHLNYLHMESNQKLEFTRFVLYHLTMRAYTF